MIDIRTRLNLVLFTAPILLVACGGGGRESSVPTDEAAPSAVEDSGPVVDSQGRDEGARGGVATADDADWGEPLTEPERYYGVYANPDRPNRAWFVAEAKRPIWAEQAPDIPPGHLEVGAMFGDVAPWPMKTVSETEFEQKSPGEYQPEPVRVEFEIDGEGSALAMTFIGDSPPEEGRLERTGDLPEEWQ